MPVMRRLLDFLIGSLRHGPRIRVAAPVCSPVRATVRPSHAARRVLLVALLLSFAGRLPAYSCDIAPTPLWQMVAEADLVVLARVEWFETRSIPFTMIDGEKEDIEFTDVHLAVLETWKGSAPNWIIVSGGEALGEGGLVVAMLQSDETLIRSFEEPALEEASSTDLGSGVARLTDEERRWMQTSNAEWRASLRGRWHPVGGSGMRIVSEPDVEVLASRIDEALRMQAQGGASHEACRAWLISRAERRATRPDAFEELMFGELRESAPDAADSDVSGVLTDEEMARIRDGFIAEPSGDADLSLIIRFFHDYADETFDLAVASAVEGMLARSQADDSTAQAVHDAVMRVTSPESPVDVHVTPDIDQLRSVWTEVLDRWEIPRVSAAEIPERSDR